MRSRGRPQRSRSTVSTPPARIMRSSACGPRYPRLRVPVNGDRGMAVDQGSGDCLRRGSGTFRREMVVVVVMAQTLVEHGPKVEVLQAKLLGNGDDPPIDLAQKTVDNVETEVDADLFLPGLPDSAMPEARRFLLRVVLLEPRLAHDEHAGRVQHRPPQRAAVMLLEVLQYGTRVRYAPANLRRFRAHLPAPHKPSAGVVLHLRRTEPHLPQAPRDLDERPRPWAPADLLS